MMEPTKGEGVNFQEVFKVLFSSAISLETGKVLSYEVACNSCKYCVEKQQALKCKNITVEEYSEWLSEHVKTCQASEYGSNCRDRVFKILELYLEVEFLVRVKGGHSSNLNESLHNNIWTIVSKTKAIDLDLLHFGASLAVIRYNDSIKNLSLSFDKL